jgi:hypothetical protein
MSNDATDLRKLLNAMNGSDVEAIAEALFGKPTGIKRVDQELTRIVDEAMAKHQPSPKQISDGVIRELQHDSGCDDGSF